jgi:hypothetical protein
MPLSVAASRVQDGAVQVKFAASSVEPEPLYGAVFGQAQRGRVRITVFGIPVLSR